ncbi:MAG: hypothetical protein ACKVIM_02190 [Flavobacteriales bacterium]
MIKIALIEVGAMHDECLHSQIQFLKHKNHEVTLFCHSDLEARVKDLPDVSKIIYLDLGTKIKKYYTWYKIRKYLINNNFSKVIFNSAERNILKLIFFIPTKIECIGTIHNAHKLIKTDYQKKITKRLKKYLTLNDFIKNNIQKEKLTSNKISCYYPIFFPKAKRSLVKPKKEIWITIPGGFDFNKRDYYIFKNWQIPKHTKIIFLGKYNNLEARKFIIDLKSHSSFSSFIFFDNYISNELFHDYIMQSDFILPLIHPNVPYYNLYLKYKISGSYNLAFAYKIPLLIEQSFSHVEDFEENSIFYNYKNINNIFNIIKKNSKEFYQNPKWEFEYQKEKYLSFIFGPKI